MRKNSNNFLPAILLMLFAPLCTEVLPGATRFSSIFVFPVEVTVWGGGALLIRAAVRKWNLGWFNMLLLAIALSLAEEFLIQQTSVAPMVIKLKGITYARFMDINYVYLLWALIYEVVFVVFVPIYLVELIFPQRQKEIWLNKPGFIIVSIFFVLGSFMAWFSWTQIARPKVFHLEAYNPGITVVAIASTCIAILIFFAIGPSKEKLTPAAHPLNSPLPWVLGVIGGLWASILYVIVVLAFGLEPDFPPAAAIAIGFALAASALYFVPRWTASSAWDTWHVSCFLFGIMLGAMLSGFVGFIGATPIDLYFKIFINVIAVVLLIRLLVKVKRDNVVSASLNP